MKHVMLFIFLLSISLGIFTGVSLYSTFAHADDWFCKEESSQRQDDKILSCGIGIAKDEAAARLIAYDSAKAEFDKICSASSDCSGHSIIVLPKRTECQDIPNGVKCYRLIEVTIWGVNQDSAIAAADETPPAAAPAVAKAEKPIVKKRRARYYAKARSHANVQQVLYTASYSPSVDGAPAGMDDWLRDQCACTSNSDIYDCIKTCQ